MGFWRDRTRGDWGYQFQYLGKLYSARGFKTKAQARMEREVRRLQAKAQFKKTPTGMAFSEVANLYLDYAKKRFVKKTYDYKKLVCSGFLPPLRDQPGRL
jgi:predicted restriction endonuclease